MGEQARFRYDPRMNPTSTELRQSEREAIVDLLHLCLYADGHIGVQESTLLSDVVEKLGWDANLSFSSYESRSIADARRARLDDTARQDFIAYAAERLCSNRSMALARSMSSSSRGGCRISNMRGRSRALRRFCSASRVSRA